MKLRLILPGLQPQARRALKNGDVGLFFYSTDSMYSLSLLCDNHDEFRKRGLLEKALICAWSNQKVTLTRIGDEIVSWKIIVSAMLQNCDRQKLLDAGRFHNPISEGQPNRVGKPCVYAWPQIQC
jgi:hypothetical protein